MRRINLYICYLPLVTMGLSLALYQSSSCRRRHGEQAHPFVENGEVWAYGEVKLVAPNRPAQLWLENLTPDESLDSTRSRLRLVAKAVSQGPDTDKDTLYYVDLASDDSNKKLVYAFDWKFQKAAQLQGTSESTNPKLTISAVLKKAGHSYQSKLIRVGTAALSKSLSLVELSSDLVVSEIVHGPKAGHWVLHPKSLQRDSTEGGNCHSSKLAPGQLESQYLETEAIPSCSVGAAEEDLCDGDPLKANCLRELTESSATNMSLEKTSLERLTWDQRIKGYTFKGDEHLPARFAITVSDIAATADNNAEQCHNLVYVTCRTVFGQVNPACIIKRDPSPQPANGQLRCAFQLIDENADIYMKKTFVISAHVVGREAANSYSFSVVKY